MTEISPAASLLMHRCDLLATCTETEGEITRPYGTPALFAARDVIAGWMRDAGMTTRVDTIGNLIGRYEAAATVTNPKTFLIGGHFDSVVNAGRYDGTLGILTGIAAVQALHDEKRQLPFALEVVAIVDEEGNRFHTSFLGSTPLAGKWDPTWLDFTDPDGVVLRDVMISNGVDPDAISNDAYSPESLLGFIEVHIEQGPVLQSDELPVAVVSSITGSNRATITIEGVAGHAGTVPMPLRKDALTAAAELVLAIERVGGSQPGLVATVGRMEVAPGATNVIPGRVEFTLDLRHSEATVRDAAQAEMQAAAADIADRRQVTLHWHQVPGFDGVVCDPALTGLISEAIAAEGYRPTSLYSGAGHDALTLAAVTPVSMIFVRCLDGVSHNPAESITTEDAAVAIRVLQGVLNRLAAQGEG